MLLSQMPLEVSLDFEAHSAKLANVFVARQMLFSVMSTEFIGSIEFQAALFAQNFVMCEALVPFQKEKVLVHRSTFVTRNA